MTVDPLGKYLAQDFWSSDVGAVGHLGLTNDCTENVSGERHNLLVMGEQHSSILLRESFLWENKRHVNQGRFFKKIYSHDFIQESSNLPFVLMLTDLEYPKLEYFSQKIMLSASSYSSHSNSPDPLHLLPIYLLKRRLRYLFSKALLSNTVDSGHKRLFKFKLVKGLPWLCTG